MKKKLAATLSVVLILGLAVLGVLAYLTDTDNDVNVMTLGNVEINQHEYDVDGKEVTDGYFGDLYPGMEVVKKVEVENTGKSDCYFRTLIAFESIESDTFEIGFPINEAYKWSWAKPEATIVIDGVTYEVYEAVYKAPLKVGETSPASLTKVVLSTAATNEDMAALGYEFDVLVLSQAVQTQGFVDAATALDTAFGDVTVETATEWFAGMGNVDYIDVDGEKVAIDGEKAAEILDALEDGQNMMFDENMDIVQFDTNAVDAKGATTTLNGQGPEAYGYLAFIPDAGEDVTVSNLNVTGSGFVEVGHYGMGGGNYTLNNVKIENLAATLKNGDKGFNLGCAFMGFGDTILNNCVMTGTTATQEGVLPVDLGCGQPWSGYTDDDNKITTTVNGGEYGTIYCWSHAVVIIDGAKVDTIYAAPINGTVTIKAGTQIETINVDYGTSTPSKTRLSKLNIEDGAVVDTIVHNGNSYTIPQWKAYVEAL